MVKPERWRSLAALVAVVAWATLGLQFYISIGNDLANGKSVGRSIVGLLGFFTILTNILVALTVSVPLLWPRSKAAAFFTRPGVRTGVATSIALVGLGYSVLLRHVWNPQGLFLVADTLLHDVIPLLFLLYWALSVPAESIGWHEVGNWMLYPTAYFVYALLRGAWLGEYPYHFIDAGQLGLARVFANALGLLVVFAVIGVALIGVGRVKGPRT